MKIKESLTEVESNEVILNELNKIDNKDVKIFAQLALAYKLIYGDVKPIADNENEILPLCAEDQNDLNEKGDLVCTKILRDTFINVRESKKERKIENFSQNQKCKARY